MKLRILLLVVVGLAAPWGAYRLGSKQAESKWKAAEGLRWEVHKTEAKALRDTAKKLASAAAKSLQNEAKAREKDALRVLDSKQQPTSASILTDRLSRYEALITQVSKVPNISNDPYPTWLIKVGMQGVKDDPMKTYHAVFKLSEDRKPTLAARLSPGLRLHLEMEPFEQQPEAVRRLPMVDDFNEFNTPVFWVKSFDHDEPSLKGDGDPYSTMFAQLPPEIVLRSPKDVAVAGGTHPFYFYGSSWSLYREWASEKLQANAPGTPRHAITALSQALKKRGIRLIFVPVPLSASVFTDIMLGRDDGAAMVGPPANESVSDLLDSLQRDGVEVLDGARVLRMDRYVEHEGSRYPVTQPNHTHLSSVGLMKLAQGVAQIISPNRTERPADKLFNVVPEVMLLPSDMVNLSAVKAIQHPIPSMPMLMVKVVGTDDSATALLSKNDSASAVQLVGDSHIGIYMKSHAGVHAHLVRELGQSVTHLGIAGNAYNAAMDAWLRSEGFEHAETVVWMVSEAYLDVPGWIDPAHHPRFLPPVQAAGKKP